MNKKHLWWIIPISLIIGYIMGSLFISSGVLYMEEKYPIIACLYNGDTQLNIDFNKMPLTKESQMRYLEKRCAETFIDFNATLQINEVDFE